jgi:hypothetical protein
MLCRPCLRYLQPMLLLHHNTCSVLQSRQHLAPAAADRVRALSCSAVLGLARDSSIRHILTKLQV